MTDRDDPAWLRAVLDAMHDMVLVKDPESHLRWANQAFLDYYSMSQEELLDLIDSPQADPDDTLQYILDDQHVVRTAKHLDIPSESVTDGAGLARHFHTVKSPIIENDIVVGTVGVSRSLDDLPATRPGPDHLEAKTLSRPLRLLIEAFPLAILLIDPMMRVVTASPRWVSHIGAPEEPTRLGQATFDVTGLVELIQRVLETGVADRIRVEVGDATYDIDAGRWHYEDQTVGGVVVVAADVTELTTQQKSLQEANERYDLVVKGNQVGIADWSALEDDEGYWSPGFYRILGYEVGEIPPSHTSLRRATHPDDLPTTNENARRIAEGADASVAELRLRTKSGAYRWVRASAQVAEPDENGRRRLVGSLEDIDERRRAQEELERINVDLDHFVHVAAHDLREPCRRQLMLVDLLLEDHADEISDRVAGRLRQVQEQSRRMLDLISAFRALTNTRGEQSEPTTVNLQNLVDEVIVEQDPDRSRARVTVDLPRSIEGHPSLLRVLFTNLIDNAHKYGGGKSISIRSTEEAGRRIFMVENDLATPLGTTPDLFKPFVRGDSSIAGSGIGLSICRRAVEAHGGEIWMDADSSHFRIRFTLGEGS